MIKNIIKLLKIKHYIKNTIVFIPLIFSLSFFNLKQTILAFNVFIAFCLIASAVYILNDIIDIKNDKLHPIKRHRPIASGTINLKLAYVLFVLLVSLSCITAYTINPASMVMIITYLILNILYSYYLKKIPIIDVVCIALGFIIRILAGCFAISVIPSPLVILLTFFTSMFFTFAKRKLEFSLVKDNDNLRKSVKLYNEQLLNQYVSINAILSIAFYFTYMLDPSTILKAQTSLLYITVIPFAIIIFRLLFLIYTCNNNDDPAEFIYKDKTTLTLLAVYFITLFLILLI